MSETHSGTMGLAFYQPASERSDGTSPALVVSSPEKGLQGEALGKFPGVRNDQGARIRALLEEEAARSGLPYETFIFRSDVKEFRKVRELFQDITSRIETCIRDSRSVVPLYPVFDEDLDRKEVSELERTLVKKPLRYLPFLSWGVWEWVTVKKLGPGDSIDFLNKPVHRLLKEAIAHLGGEEIAIQPILVPEASACVDPSERAYFIRLFPDLRTTKPLYYLSIWIVHESPETVFRL